MSKSKKFIIFLAWIAITVGVQMFGYSVMEYLKFIIGPRTMRYLTGGVGIFVVIFFLGVVLHYCIHRLTEYSRS